jgi:putative ABC transport system permease protein
MRWIDIMGLAAESLRLHKLRTGLTLTGIAIGVTAVLLLTALGEAAKGYVVNEFAGIGTNLVIVLPGKVETSGTSPTFGGTVRDLTIDDVEALRRRVPAARQVAEISIGTAAFDYGGRSRTVRIIGATAEYAQVRNLKVAAGQFIQPGDPREGDRVAVIGQVLQREVFQGENPLGKSVRIGDMRFRVIGVLASKGETMGFNMDDIAIVPVATGLKMFNQSSLFRVMVQAIDPSAIPAVMKQTRDVLLERHDRDEDFTLITQDAMLKTFGRIIDSLTMALAGIAAISLAVAGIGIMNVMLVSVSERTTEVGLLKALGARRKQILSVFMMEALSLSVIGALIGIVFGVSITLTAAAFLPSFPIRPNMVWIGIVLLLALLSGTGFGILPARQAARLQAADAIRGKM